MSDDSIFQIRDVSGPSVSIPIAAIYMSEVGIKQQKEKTMKTTTYAACMTVIAILMASGNALGAYHLKQLKDMREACSYQEDVHISNCVIQAVNVSAKDKAPVTKHVSDQQVSNNRTGQGMVILDPPVYSN